MPRPVLENTPYFVTTSTINRKPVFADPDIAQVLIDVIYHFRALGRYLLLGFVVMPDHLHLCVVLTSGVSISAAVQSIKRGCSRLLTENGKYPGTLWNKGFFDRIPRDEKELLNEISYMHGNPVKSGLVSRGEDHLFSSANPRFETDLELYLSGINRQTG